MPPTAIVLLAAGSSSRMGAPKQLLRYRGQPLIRHAAEMAQASAAERVIVVLGANAADVAPALAGLSVEIACNDRWSEGMGTSIQTGVRSAQALGAGAVILALADQPHMAPPVYNRLIEEGERSGCPIVASEYANTVGVPVLFTKECFAHLLALEPSQGCKGVILAHANSALRIACPEAEADIDTPEDYARLGRA
jgi:molybdenum cofactor cytidylyltransferase